MLLADLPTSHLLKRAKSLREMARETADDRSRKAILQVALEYEAEASSRANKPERLLRQGSA
jgi:hypothetical protein